MRAKKSKNRNLRKMLDSEVFSARKFLKISWNKFMGRLVRNSQKTEKV
jgi:hypothetical protein